MKFKFQLIILLFTAILSCDEAEDISESELVVESPPEEEVVEEDATKPVITIIGLTDIIEKKTDISIQIEDESTVETKVLHNGEELISSSEKQFDLRVNPYPIPVGATDFIVVSKDALGNETTETYSVEIKHLLIENFYIELITDVVDVSFKNLIFFNNLDGKELAVFEPMGPNEKVYTDETIMEEYILFTSVNHTVFPQSTSGGRNQSLWLRTHKIPLGMKRREGINNYFEPQNTVEVTLKGIPLVNGSPDFYAYGEGYKTVAHSGNETETTLTIKHDGVLPIYIRTSRRGGSTPKFDGKKENYRYVVIRPETGNTALQIEEDQLREAESTLKLNIPEQDPGTLSFQRNGFESAEDFLEPKGAIIYHKGPSGETNPVDYLDLPVFSNLQFYYNSLRYSKNGISYNARGTDSNIDVNIPNWQIAANLLNESIEIDASNPDVDYYSVGLNKRKFDNGISLSMRWSFIVDGTNNIDASIPLLNIPLLIKEAVNEPYFQTTEGMEINRLEAVDDGSIDSYDELVDRSVFSNFDLVSTGQSYRQVNFPISNTSGKSKTMKGLSNSNMFYHDTFDINTNEPRPRTY